jgi:hypothetical protein
VEAVAILIGFFVFVGAIYLIFALVGWVLPLDKHGTAATLLRGIQFWVSAVLLAGGLMVSVAEFFSVRKAARARKANEKIAAAFTEIKQNRPEQNVAEISSEAVAKSLKDSKINPDQLARLAEQRKQQLLIDDEYFRKDLSLLIVDYLQPLPRNAKRLLNRFRVNLLIAHSRGLLTSDPRVTPQQMGKWLVLMERWPQLGRSLSATPAKLQALEQHAASPVLANPDNSASAAFADLIKILAPPYLGDEDLRKFIHSAPALGAVAQRLAHYGADELSS